jgi:hypothetical protein
MKNEKVIKLVLFIFSCTLISCQTKKVSEDNEISYDTLPTTLSFPKYQDRYVFRNESLLEYQKILNRLDSLTVDNTKVAATKFDSLFADADMATCDSAYYLFEKFYSKMLQGLNELHTKNQVRFDSLIFYKEESKHSQFLNDYTASLGKNGFFVSSSEGMTFVKEDRSFVNDNFYKKLSSAMIEYLSQLDKENERVYWDDGALIIEPSELVDRLIWWENFNKSNLHLFRKNAVQWEKIYLYSLVLGEDNTPIYHYDDPKLNEYFESAYNYLFDKYPNSKYSGFLKNYHIAFIKSDTIVVNKYQSQVKELTK